MGAASAGLAAVSQPDPRLKTLLPGAQPLLSGRPALPSKEARDWGAWACAPLRIHCMRRGAPVALQCARETSGAPSSAHNATNGQPFGAAQRAPATTWMAGPCR